MSAAGTGRRRRPATVHTTPLRTGDARLLHGECIETLASLDASSVDAIVTDPPYGISWKDEAWDGRAIVEAVARAGHDRLTPNQSFEAWCEMWGRECLRVMRPGAHLLAFGSPRTWHRLTAGLEDAGFEIRDTLMWMYGTGMPKTRRYQGDRAAALKPAFEPIVLARRPLVGTVEENVRRHGTGLLEVGECRGDGRHPADVVLSHEAGCEKRVCAPGCAVALLDADSEQAPSRFFYCPKASRSERDAGCDALPEREFDHYDRVGMSGPAHNTHPSVKPLELMRWLVRLVCPPAGLVLDPFTGSGTTGAAAAVEGRRFTGIEREAPYMEIAAARIDHWAGEAVAGRRGGRPLARRS